jgi:hypothetical protein
MNAKEELLARLKSDYPSETQLESINRWRPYGQPEYSANEVLTISILASDNLLRESREVYTEKTLKSMAATYPGEVLMMNHAWGDVGEAIGFVYDSEILRFQNPSYLAQEIILRNSIDEEIDKQLIQAGYVAVICHCAIPADSVYANAIRFRQLSDVSTGGMAAANYICPLCGGDFGDDDPHYPPTWFSYLLAEWGEISEEDIAPYAFFDSWHRSKELSFVTAGNVPSASIFSEELIKLVYI